jgi:hypothetical protein
MAKYRKKPVVIEAIQYNRKNRRDALEFCPDAIYHTDYILRIKTLEGVMIADEGDYIIKGIKGEFYPCKPDIFEASYDAVED